MGTAIIGLQWGDEGKGKVVDYLSPHYDVIVRYQGGPNAGHTVIYEGEEVVLHHIPSGIFQKNTICVIGNGCVIDLEAMIEEIERIEYLGVNTTGRIFVSDRAHLILPYQKDEEAKLEKTMKIGTTLKGVGVSYTDKYARRGLRMGDLEDPDRLKEVLKMRTKDARKVKNLLMKLYDETAHLMVDTVSLLHHFWKSGKKILFEGAQGTMLDVDFGTYPYVTSSNPTIGGLFAGTGLPPASVDRVIGVMKAYTTRVGGGPFPTEIKGKLAKQLREKGGEFGATTGRERRIGWLDLFQVKWSAQINGVNEIILTKIDVIAGVESIKVGVNYLLDGESLEFYPATTDMMKRIEVEYVDLPGWPEIDENFTWYKAPRELKDFKRFIEHYLSIPVTMVSTGRRREDVFLTD